MWLKAFNSRTEIGFVLHKKLSNNKFFYQKIIITKPISSYQHSLSPTHAPQFSQHKRYVTHRRNLTPVMTSIFSHPLVTIVQTKSFQSSPSRHKSDYKIRNYSLIFIFNNPRKSTVFSTNVKSITINHALPLISTQHSATVTTYNHTSSITNFSHYFTYLRTVTSLVHSPFSSNTIQSQFSNYTSNLLHSTPSHINLLYYSNVKVASCTNTPSTWFISHPSLHNT